ncbi:hypothetical protein [uncultured Flavobacterium sp.]|uniref:hypothetical protein n=1 Tax=uncultured Flavobacterium sp. TaxID=165435 RepID=UPI0030EF1FD7|tara:strand:+ start:275391 stop:276365 length:975 start_codon:yes stop_codon:yes gene_type:complete
MDILRKKLNLIIPFLLIFSLISCSKDEEILQNEIVNEENIDELIEFTIDGITYKSVNNDLGFMILMTDYQGTARHTVNQGQTPTINYNFNYKFTQGGALLFFELEETIYTESQNILKKFKTPTYKPLNAFQINKFEYDETTNKVTIEFSGTLNSNTNSLESRQIEGKIIQNLGVGQPWGRDYCYLKSNGGTLDVLSSYYQVWGNGSGNQNINYVTGDGYNISIQLDQPLINYNNLTFNENSTINRVLFKKALSPYLINDADLGSVYSQQVWEEYKTSGNLIVTDVYIGNKPGGGLHIKGLINLTVLDDNNNVLDILELEFVTIN